MLDLVKVLLTCKRANCADEQSTLPIRELLGPAYSNPSQSNDVSDFWNCFLKLMPDAVSKICRFHKLNRQTVCSHCQHESQLSQEKDVIELTLKPKEMEKPQFKPLLDVALDETTTVEKRCENCGGGDDIAHTFTLHSQLPPEQRLLVVSVGIHDNYGSVPCYIAFDSSH